MSNELDKTIDELQQFAYKEVVEVKEASAPQNNIMAKHSMEMVHISNYINMAKDGYKIQNALDKHPEYSHQKILEFASLGLSIANNDYYIIPYGDKPKFDVDYRGLLKVASNEAKKSGFQLIAKADTIRKGFKELEVSTKGLIDDISLVNGKINEEILTAYCILALLDMNTHKLIMQKVEVLPIKEYEKAKSSSKGGTIHKDYQSEMAKKIALRRAVKILNTMFPSNVLDKLFNLDNENYVDINQKSSNKKSDSGTDNYIGFKKD